jgi:hypothetical protein
MRCKWVRALDDRQSMLIGRATGRVIAGAAAITIRVFVAFASEST